MTSVSVKNRAKMFEDLASSNQSDELTPRKAAYQRGGNAISSSPFLAASSPTRSAASVPYASSFMSSSPKSWVSAPYQQTKDRPTFYGGASPRNKNTSAEWERPTQYTSSPRIVVPHGESRDRPFHHQYNGSSPGSRQASPSWERPSHYGSSPKTGNSPSEWLGEEEENIPVPSVIRKYQVSEKYRELNGEYLKPVILPTRKSPDISPFKALQNKDVRPQYHVPSQSQSPVSGSPLKALQNKDHHQFKPQSQILSNHFMKQQQSPTVNQAKVIESPPDSETDVVDRKSFVDLAENHSMDRSSNSDSENRAPDIDGGRTKSSRALRLMRAKHAGAFLPPPASDSSLRQSLNAAKVVMEEEKSNAGSSNASTRSSLSNKELSNIASRAIRMADNTASGQGTKTFSNVSHMHARKAMLHVAATKRKEKEDERKLDVENADQDVTERLGAMAKRAVAMKKSSKSPANEATTRSLEITSSTSYDSNRSRRLEHPAFAARTSPNLKAKIAATKVSSADILTSFRQFNAARSSPAKPKEVQSLAREKSQALNVASKVGRHRQLQDKPGVSSEGANNRIVSAKWPKKSIEPPKTDPANDTQSLVSGDGSVNSRSTSLLDQEETMHSMGNGNRDYTNHSTSNSKQDESMHSSSERNHIDEFYGRRRVQVTSKSSFNEAYLSSLSSNTFSNQSIMSQSIVSSMKSPAARSQNERIAFRLDPTPEYSTQTMKSEFTNALSPGPSARSGHSIANSIISASPMSAAQSPDFEADFDVFFVENEKKSSSSGWGVSKSPKESKGSTELLDITVEAAVADMIVVDTPKNRTPKAADLSGREVIEPTKQTAETEQTKETIEFAAIRSPKMKVDFSKTVSILPNESGRSHSPPGFIFNDSDESDPVVIPPDPAGHSGGKDGLVLSDCLFEPDLDDDEDATADNESTDKSDVSRNAELKQDGLKMDNSGDFEIKETPAELKQGSSSTKRTVSTSIRSGMSSIQNDSVELPVELVAMEGNEGSTSIRTGLSDIQSPKKSNESDNSNTMHSTQTFPNVSVDAFPKETVNMVPVDPRVSANLLSRYPETIQEERDTTKSPPFSCKSSSKSSSKDETTAFFSAALSGIKDNHTSTTDASSGVRTGSGGSSSDPASSDSGAGNETGFTGFSGYNTYATFETPLGDHDSEPATTNLLPPIRTEDGEADENFASPISRSSRAWPGTFGKRVGDAIKNVLAKASPNAGVSTPSGQEKRPESRSLFSSVDDDDDIFGGLEEDEKFFEELKMAPMAPVTPRTDAKTPKQANFKSGGKKDIPVRSNGSPPPPRAGLPSPSGQAAGSPRNPIRPPKKDTRLTEVSKTPLSSLLKKHRPWSPSGLATNPHSLYSNDRSGTVVDESEVLHNVNSDITSSFVGGPNSGPSVPSKSTKAEDSYPTDDFEVKNENSDSVSKDKPPRSPMSKSSRKSKASKTSLKSDQKSLKAEKKNSSGRYSSKSKVDMKSQPDQAAEVEVEEEHKPRSSMFMSLGCGGLVDLSSGFASLCTPANKVDPSGYLEPEDDPNKDFNSVSSHSRLTELEKKVWSEWDRLNGSVIDAPTDVSSEKPVDKKEVHDKKREAARDKLLDIASTAMSSHLSVKSGKSLSNEAVESTMLAPNEQIVSASVSTESGGTKDTGSGASGNTSATESGESAGSSSQEASTQGSSTYYSSGAESDFVSNEKSTSTHTKSTTTPTAGPILLSFSQRSLMEKFTKQLSAVGVEVLKLNRRKQWQIRYFTVSQEQIALSAHEAVTKTGEIAKCPKALLWLKKFNPKNGGYGITSIDKEGHGGMLLVDLVDVQVSDTEEDTLECPIPKKLDKFKNSVRVTLQYKMNGILRSIEFRCKDNDEAQFLCTCMRVIRDLLRRERSLRQKSNKDQQKKKSLTPQRK